MLPPVWKLSCIPRAHMPMGVIPTSTSCSNNRRASATPPSARPFYTRSNGSPSSARCLRRSWICAGSRVWGHVWLSIPSTRFPCTLAQRWRTCDSKNHNGGAGHLVGRLKGQGGVAHENAATWLGQRAIQHENGDYVFAPRD